MRLMTTAALSLAAVVAAAAELPAGAADGRHERATFEILAGSMPPAFETFLELLPDFSLEEFGPGPEGQAQQVVQWHCLVREESRR
jgi:hypothetical protein